MSSEAVQFTVFAVCGVIIIGAIIEITLLLIRRAEVKQARFLEDGRYQRQLHHDNPPKNRHDQP